MKITAIQLAKRVETWQHRLGPLGVGHFRIEAVHLTDETPNGKSANASVWCPRHYDNAEFWFTHDFLEETDERGLDETIIHEWLHVAWRDMDEALDRVEAWMPPHAYVDFEDIVNHEREGLIERAARMIADLYHNN